MVIPPPLPPPQYFQIKTYMYEIIQALMALHGEVYDFLYKHITLFDKIRIKQPVITQLNQEILGNKCTKPLLAL